MERHAALAALLSDAGDAHGAYERDALGGRYDDDWATWYAAYLVAHGFADALGRPITAEEVRDLLIACDRAHKAEGITTPWPDDYARRIAASSEQ